MKVLKELSLIINKKKVQNIEIIDGNILKQKSNKLNKFYHGLISGQFQDDDDAALHIYGATPDDERYRQLKTRFRKRLLNTLFLLEVKNPSKPNYEKALINCQREWALVQILQLNKAKESTVKLAHHVLNIALQYHFTLLIIESARLLRKISAENGEKKDFATYNEYIHHYLPRREAEIVSEELLQTVYQQYLLFGPGTDRNQLEEEMIEHCARLLNLSERFNTPQVNYHMFLAWIMRYELQRDYKNMLAVCDQTEKYLNDQPYFTTVEKEAEVLIKKLSVYLHTGAFQKSKAAIEKKLDGFEPGAKYWFSILEVYLLTAIHTENYISALAIFNQAVGHPAFAQIPDQEAQKWFSYEVYLHYFIEIKQLNTTISYHRRPKKFHLDEFLDHQYTFPKELVNLTVQLSCAQILFLFERHNLRTIAEKINHLRKYALPQLKRKKNERTLYFVRLLQQLIRTDFQIDPLIYKSRNLQRLQTTPFHYRGRVGELEILPYEKCWQRIVLYLSNS